MSKGKKLALGLVIVVLVIVVGLAIMIPLLVDVDRYRPQVAAQIQEQTGKPAQIGKLALTIFPQVAIRVDDFSLSNPPGFPPGSFVKAQRIYAVVDGSALMHRQVVIKSLELDAPNIRLLSDIHGKWNFEGPKKPAMPNPPPSDDKSSFSLGVISKVSVKHGEVMAANLLASGATGPSLMEVHGAALDLEDVSLNALSETSLRRSDSPAQGLAVLRGWIGSIAYAAETQAPLVAQGTIKADSLKFGPLGVAKLNSKLRLYPKQVFFDDLDLKCYGGGAKGNLSLNFAGTNLEYSTDARLKGINVAQFLNAFPQARGMMTGTLDGTAKVNGEVADKPDPLAGVHGGGQIEIRKGQMPSLQLNKNLRMLAQITSLGPANGDASSFSSISADFKIAAARLSSSKIVLVGNGVDVDGSGSMTMAGEGSLDYQGDASLAAGGSNPLTSVLAGLSGATVKDGKMVFPFGVTGTLAKPKFALKGGGKGPGTAPLTGAAAQDVDMAKGIVGLFRKKKPQ
jgi:uncharacterized protein involved in outer membrane biogenesis